MRFEEEVLRRLDRIEAALGICDEKPADDLIIDESEYKYQERSLVTQLKLPKDPSFGEKPCISLLCNRSTNRRR